MAISRNEVTAGILVVGVVGILSYLAYDNVTNKVAPATEVAAAGGFSAALDACTEQEFFVSHLAVVNQGMATTPHRYPNTTGGNISTLIHRGFSQLRLPAPMDDKWITRPPAEVMW